MNYGLLISKVNDIQVIQIGESRLKVEHKKHESRKPSNKKGKVYKKESGGENKTVDLGAGAKKHSIKIKTRYKEETEALFDILYNERYCTIIDKFIGTLSVYIDEVEIVNDDKYINATIFSISATVQDIEKKPADNPQSQLTSTITSLESTLSTFSSTFTSMITTLDTAFNALTNIETFVDSMMNIAFNGLSTIFNFSYIGINFFEGIKEKINSIRSIKDTLKLIDKVPNKFVDLLLNATNVVTDKNIEIYYTTTSTNKIIKNLDEDLSEYSQIEIEQIKKDVVSNQLLNLTIAVGEMRQILTRNYKTKQDFDLQVNLCVDRLEYTPLEYSRIAEIQHIIKSFAVKQKIKNIIDHTIEKETPLVSIIYGLYGNLDYYEEIRDLNNFADNDAIIGTIKVYDASIS